MKNNIPKTQSLKSQSVWLMLAKLVSFVFSTLLPILVVRYLTQNEVGLYRQSFQVIVTASAILPLGFSMSAFYFLNRETEHRNAAILNITIFNFIIGGLACLLLNLYPQILGIIFQNDEMERLAPKIGVVIWLWIFSAFLEIVTLANQETRLATAFIILAQLTKTTLMVGAVIIFATVEAFLIAAIVQGSLQTIILLFYLNAKFRRFWRQFDWQFLRDQALYVLPFGIIGLLGTMQTDIHYYFVGYRFSEAEYAVYAYGCFQLPLLGMLVESANTVLLPRMNELQLSDDKREIISLTVRAMKTLAIFCFPTYFFLLITANVFITTLFTEKYLDSVPVFVIYLTLVPLNILFITDSIARAFQEFGKIWLLVRLFITIAMVAALYFGIQYFALRGMIAIVVAGNVIDRLTTNFILARRMGVMWHDWRLLTGIGRTALAAAVSGGIFLAFTHSVGEEAIELCKSISRTALSLVNIERGIDFVGGSLFLILCFFLYVLVYLIMADRLGAIDSDDKVKLLGIWRKLIRRPGKEPPPSLA